MSKTSHVSRGRCQADGSPWTPLLPSLTITGGLLGFTEFCEGMGTQPIEFVWAPGFSAPKQLNAASSAKSPGQTAALLRFQRARDASRFHTFKRITKRIVAQNDFPSVFQTVERLQQSRECDQSLLRNQQEVQRSILLADLPLNLPVAATRRKSFPATRKSISYRSPAGALDENQVNYGTTVIPAI